DVENEELKERRLAARSHRPREDDPLGVGRPGTMFATFAARKPPRVAQAILAVEVSHDETAAVGVGIADSLLVGGDVEALVRRAAARERDEILLARLQVEQPERAVLEDRENQARIGGPAGAPPVGSDLFAPLAVRLGDDNGAVAVVDMERQQFSV